MNTFTMNTFQDKVAIVTGASSGIGRATAILLAKRGAAVVLAARRGEELAELAAEIEADGGKASAIQTDVSIASDVERMVAHATHKREPCGKIAAITVRIRQLVEERFFMVDAGAVLPAPEREIQI